MNYLWRSKSQEKSQENFATHRSRAIHRSRATHPTFNLVAGHPTAPMGPGKPQATARLVEAIVKATAAMVVATVEAIIMHPIIDIMLDHLFQLQGVLLLSRLQTEEFTQSWRGHDPDQRLISTTIKYNRLLLPQFILQAQLT